MFPAGCLSKRSNFVTISTGERILEHKGIIVKPKVVLLDKSRKLLSDVERTVNSDPRTPSAIDCLSARISAYVVAFVIERPSFRSIDVRLYLSYPDNIRTEIEAQLGETVVTVQEHRRLQRDRASHTGGTIPPIPGQARAYTFSALPEHEKSVWSHYHG